VLESGPAIKSGKVQAARGHQLRALAGDAEPADDSPRAVFQAYRRSRGSASCAAGTTKAIVDKIAKDIQKSSIRPR
jgi:hypothetical protein